MSESIQTVRDTANEIERLYDAAIDIGCTCGVDPEKPCRACSAWSKAHRESVDIIARATAAQAEQIAALQKVFDKEHLHTCVHHNDAERRQAGCPVCLRTQLNKANAAAGERLEALKKIHAILQQRDNSYFHDMVEEWLEDYAQPVMRNDCGTSLLRELEQLRAELKSQYERDWTASIIDRLNEFARENAGQFSEIDTGQQAAAMVRDMHGCYNSLRHLNTDLRQSLDQLRQEQDELLKDKERLDWLEANPPQVQITWVNVHSGRRWTADNCADHKSYETLRAAIDAALHPTSKEQP